MYYNGYRFSYYGLGDLMFFTVETNGTYTSYLSQ